MAISETSWKRYKHYERLRRYLFVIRYEFKSKASKVQQAIKDMLDGKINPEDVKIEGIETEQEKQENEVD